MHWKMKAVFGLCKSISGKYFIFWKCYFLEKKIFSCVWLHFKKIFEKYFLVFGKEEGKDKPSKTRTKLRKNPEKKSSTIDARLGSKARYFASSSPTTAPSIAIDGAISQRRDHDRRREIAISRRREDRDWCCEIVIDGAISRSVNHDLGSRSSDWSSRDRRGLELGVRRQSSDWIGARSSTIAHSLSLSLFPEILWSENESVKWFL